MLRFCNTFSPKDYLLWPPAPGARASLHSRSDAFTEAEFLILNASSILEEMF